MAINTVNSAGIADGSIVNADIKSDAAIAKTKLAALNIVNADITDDTISEVKLDIHNAPSGTDKVLGYTSNGMEWTVAAAGATGGGTDKIFWENGQTVTTLSLIHISEPTRPY